MSGCEVLCQVRFSAAVIEWRGPAPFFFVAVPDEAVGEIRYAARIASYGWGCVPVSAKVADITFTTSLFPKDGGYLVPLKLDVRRRGRIEAGDRIEITLTVAGPA